MMHVTRSFMLAVAGLACLVSIMTSTDATAQDLPELYGVRLEEGSIVVDVVSTGCTEVAHFSVELQADPGAAGQYRLSVSRTTPDRCRMAPYIITVTLPIPRGVTPAPHRFLLMNRLALPGGLLRSGP
jgi:hypothetical protein